MSAFDPKLPSEFLMSQGKLIQTIGQLVGLPTVCLALFASSDMRQRGSRGGLDRTTPHLVAPVLAASGQIGRKRTDRRDRHCRAVQLRLTPQARWPIAEVKSTWLFRRRRLYRRRYWCNLPRYLTALIYAT
jgi:hypothetical protein